MTRSGTRPLVSFGLPVRNGVSTIGQAIESVLTQTVGDWELIISDNRSTDGTSEICAGYASRDERIRHVPAEQDLSIHENFQAAFRHSSGTYFRWHGDDDWLEPDYLQRTIAALEESPAAVLCTTQQRYYRDGQPLPINDSVSLLGGVDSADPSRRIRALLRLFEAGSMGIDPVYSIARRDVAARTGLQGSIRDGDFVYSCEMALLGQFVHVPEVLAHRRLFTPSRTGISRNFLQREQAIVCVARASKGLRLGSRLRISSSLVSFAVREHVHGMRRRARAVRSRLRGLET
jgi:glycosyltransferase involved in cell wall biosynthesis